MSRLTTRMSIMGRKHDIERGQANHWKKLLKDYDYPLIEEVVDKLGELEDIEDELGIDLVTLFKALKNGVWVKLEYFGCKTTNIVFEKAFYFGKVIDEEKPVIRAECREYYLKDYGKTWALTKKELEE